MRVERYLRSAKSRVLTYIVLILFRTMNTRRRHDAATEFAPVCQHRSIVSGTFFPLEILCAYDFNSARPLWRYLSNLLLAKPSCAKAMPWNSSIPRRPYRPFVRMRVFLRTHIGGPLRNPRLLSNSKHRRTQPTQSFRNSNRMERKRLRGMG